MGVMKLMATGLVLAAAPMARAATYDIDVSHSSMGFGVKHMVVTTTRGTFADFSGSFDYDPADPASLRASVKIQVASIDTDNAKRDDHLRGSDFFDAPNHPEIVFESTRAEQTEDGVTLYGNLTMRGVTKEIAIPLTVTGPVTDPWQKVRVGLEGKTRVNRQDWGISWSKAMDNGGLVVDDYVTLDIVVEGIQK